MGLEIGVELQKKDGLYKKVVDAAFQKGLHLTGDGESVLQLMPPLTIPQDVLAEGVDILINVIINS